LYVTCIRKVIYLLKLKLSHYAPRRRLGENRYRSYIFSTSALDGGEWSASRPVRALSPGKGPLVTIVQEAGWTPDSFWTLSRGKIVTPLPGIEPRSPSRPAHSQTLYLLSYPSHLIYLQVIEIHLSWFHARTEITAHGNIHV
jgi:hypothetical protein